MGSYYTIRGVKAQYQNVPARNFWHQVREVIPYLMLAPLLFVFGMILGALFYFGWLFMLGGLIAGVGAWVYWRYIR